MGADPVEVMKTMETVVDLKVAEEMGADPVEVMKTMETVVNVRKVLKNVNQC